VPSAIATRPPAATTAPPRMNGPRVPRRSLHSPVASGTTKPAGGVRDLRRRDAERLRVGDERQRSLELRARRAAPADAGALEVAPVARGREQADDRAPRSRLHHDRLEPPVARVGDRVDVEAEAEVRQVGEEHLRSRTCEERRPVGAQRDLARPEAAQLGGERADAGGEVGGVRPVVAVTRARVEAGADALDRVQALPRRDDVERVDGGWAPAHREPGGRGPVDRDAERAGDVVRATRRQQRRDRQRNVEVGERVHRPVAAGEDDAAVLRRADDGGQLGRVRGHVRANARACRAQCGRRGGDDVGARGAARAAVDDELDLAADDGQRRRAASACTPLVRGGNRGVEGGLGRHLVVQRNVNPAAAPSYGESHTGGL
jgi:hypothetical protein